MKLYKDIISNDNYVITLINEKNEMFKIQYADGNLYWIMINYRDNNSFKITKDDTLLYSQMEELFLKIKKENNDSFEWKSEKSIIASKGNMLLIKRSEGTFTIKFIRNPKNHTLMGFCPICFHLNNSRNPQVVRAFDDMLMEYNNKAKVKALKK